MGCAFLLRCVLRRGFFQSVVRLLLQRLRSKCRGDIHHFLPVVGSRLRRGRRFTQKLVLILVAVFAVIVGIGGGNRGEAEVGGRVADDLALVDGDDAVIEFAHQLMLVRHNEHRGAHRVDLTQQVKNLVGELGVDVARRLVRNDDLGIVDQCARQTDALLLAARQLGGLVLHFVLQADQIEHIGHALFDGGSALADRTHGKRHVVKDVHLVDQAEVLKDDAHMAAKIRHMALFQAGKLVAVDGDFARGRDLLTHNQLEKGAFARARSAHDEHELALVDVQGDVVQRIGAVGIGFGYVFKINHSNS